MKDYAKILNQTPQKAPPKKAVKHTLARTAIQKNKEAMNEKSGRGWLYIVIFLIIAVLVASAFRQHLQHQGSSLSKKEKAAVLQAHLASSDPNAAGPQFDFYTTLPNGKNPGVSGSSSELPAPTGPVPPPAAPAVDSSATAPTAPVTASLTSGQKYYLNAGTFSNSADAQQMLAQLLLLGINVNIENTQDNGQPAYQVMVGPFDDEDTMNVVKQQLDAHQILSNVVEK